MDTSSFAGENIGGLENAVIPKGEIHTNGK
jgi:hypothetical protein